MQRQHVPSQSVVDEGTGSKWRLCAAAAVLDSSRDRLLVGERAGMIPGMWQCPQGGVDDEHVSNGEAKGPETVQEAATRELYEEMGLVLGRDVMLLGGCSPSLPPVRYSTSGTGSWLEREGYAGQELHWVLFQSASEGLDHDPNRVCDLSGQNGERAEFVNVKWDSVDAVVQRIWEKKREPYEALAKHLKEKLP